MIAEASIGQAFAQGQSLYRAIDEGNAPPDEQNKFTFDAIGCFEQVNTSIASLSLISSNETASDVNTGDLKYVLADFYLAELHLKIGEMASRERNLEIAAGCYFRFLSRCEQLQLMSESDLKTWKDQEEGNQPDPGTLREQKISAFKRERALKQRLQQLAARAAAAAGGAGGGGGNDEQEEEEEEEEEEVAREALLVTLELGVARSLAELRAVEEERRLLARFAPQARAAAAATTAAKAGRFRCRASADLPRRPGRRVYGHAPLAGRALGPGAGPAGDGEGRRLPADRGAAHGDAGGVRGAGGGRGAGAAGGAGGGAGGGPAGPADRALGAGRRRGRRGPGGAGDLQRPGVGQLEGREPAGGGEQGQQ
ncbi:unnamed protein product, partial [Heterosigma akashiwo]